MKITTATLCDFAQVREGLLFLSSGCISRIMRTELPARLGVHLALVVELDEFEITRRHQAKVRVVGPDGQELANVDGSFQIDATLEVGELLQVPLAIPLIDVAATERGGHDVKIYLDGNHAHTLTFWVVVPPAQPPAPMQDPGTN